MNSGYTSLKHRYGIDDRSKIEKPERGIDIARRVGIRITDIKRTYYSNSAEYGVGEIFIAQRMGETITGTVSELIEIIEVSEYSIRRSIKKGYVLKGGWTVSENKEKS